MSLFHRDGRISCCTEDCSSDVAPIHRARLIAGGKERKGDKQSSSNPSNLFGNDPEEEFNNDVSRPRKVFYHGILKPHQDAACWIHLARAQQKGLQFWQTRSHAIDVHDSVVADCTEQVVSQGGDTTRNQRLSTLGPAQKIDLKSVRKLRQQQQQQQQDTQRGVGKPLAEQLPRQINRLQTVNTAPQNAVRIQ